MSGNIMGRCLCNFLGTSVLIAGCTFLFIIAFPIAQITLGVVSMYECPAAPLIPVYVMVCGIVALMIMGLFAVSNFICLAAPSKNIWTVLILILVLFAFVWFLFGSYHIYSIHPPSYTKVTINPNSSNNSFHTPTASDNKLSVIMENQNQSLPSSNRTRMINNNNNQTLMKLIQTLTLSNISSETNRERLNAAQVHHVVDAVPYCNRTLYLFAFWTTTLVYVLAGHALVITICIFGYMKIANKLTKYIMS